MDTRILKKKVTYTLPEVTVQMIQEEAKKRNLNMSVLVQLALEDFCRKEKTSDKWKMTPLNCHSIEVNLFLISLYSIVSYEW